MNSLEIITRQISGWWFFLIKNVAKTTPLSSSASWWRKTDCGLTFTLWVGKDIESHWWERWKVHLISSEALNSLSPIKWDFLFFRYLAAVMLCRQVSSPCAISKKSHLPNTSGTILVMWFGILKNRLANGTVLTWIFRVTNWFCGHNGSSLSLFVHQKIQMGFLFYNLKKKNLTIKLFKYLREMALRSSNEKKKKLPVCVFFFFL